jgi:hypothetical protein
LFLHLGHANPFVLVPHFLQVMSIPTMSRAGVLVAFIIKIAATKMPTTIAISIRTILYITKNKHKEIYRILHHIFNNIESSHSALCINLGAIVLHCELKLRSEYFAPTFYMKIHRLTHRSIENGYR